MTRLVRGVGASDKVGEMVDATIYCSFRTSCQVVSQRRYEIG